MMAAKRVSKRGRKPKKLLQETYVPKTEVKEEREEYDDDPMVESQGRCNF